MLDKDNLVRKIDSEMNKLEKMMVNSKKINQIKNLKIDIVKKTKIDQKPKHGDTVGVNYIGKFSNGKIFDKNLSKNKPFYFKLGQGQVIKGWELAIPKLKLNQIAKVFIPYNLAYGDKGTSNGIIPPQTNLLFYIQIIKIFNN